MTSVTISNELKSKIPGLELCCIECNVIVKEDNPELWKKINDYTLKIANTLKAEDISLQPVIAASRRGYKQCGKDPARYRLSAEALLRRLTQGKTLYKVNNVVDVLNLISVSTGFSIGGYDVEKINGNIEFGIGRPDEPYEGIGRGILNIESLPVFRDNNGAFGTPTSDSVRTAVTSKTQRFLMIIIDFGTTGLLEKAATLAENLLSQYAGANNLQLGYISK